MPVNLDHALEQVMPELTKAPTLTACTYGPVGAKRQRKIRRAHVRAVRPQEITINESARFDFRASRLLMVIAPAHAFF